MTPDRIRSHLIVLASLYLAFSILGFIGAMITFVTIAGGGLISGEMEAIVITSAVGSIIGGFLTLTSLPGLVGGVALLGHRVWARYLVLVLSFLNLLALPIGTALGIYGIWLLMKSEVAQFFADAAAARAAVRNAPGGAPGGA